MAWQGRLISRFRGQKSTLTAVRHWTRGRMLLSGATPMVSGKRHIHEDFFISHQNDYLLSTWNKMRDQKSKFQSVRHDLYIQIERGQIKKKKHSHLWLAVNMTRHIQNMASYYSVVRKQNKEVTNELRQLWKTSGCPKKWSYINKLAGESTKLEAG